MEPMEAKQIVETARCRGILKEQLKDTQLPLSSIKRLKKQFDGEIFLARELEVEIAKERFKTRFEP